MRPDYAEAWNNRANLLMDRGRAARDEGDGAACDAFWDRADDCFRKAADIRSELFQAWSGWSSLSLHRAAAAPEDQKPAYWRKCGKLLEKTASLSRTEALYNMACLAGQQGRARDCLRLLEEAHAAGSLPPLRHLERDADLDGVRDTEAFRTLVETLRRKGA